MKLSFSTNAFTRHTVVEAVERIAAAGYEGVELLADAPHLFADTTTEADLARIKAAIEDSGLRVANVNANTAMGYYGRQFWEPLFEPSLANPDPTLRQWRVDYTLKCIDMAAALGSPCISVTSGKMVPGTLPEQSMELLCGSLEQVLRYAVAKGVRVGIEYEPGLLVERYEELAVLLDTLRSPWLGANLDLGHSRVLEEDPEEIIGELGSRIFHAHIEDIRAGKHYHLIPGSGDMDFPHLLGLLDRHAGGEFATVELYTYPQRPEEAARLSLAHLRGVCNARSSFKTEKERR